jgi:glucose-6-phosphate-specific signal transduction histidine kinase
MQRELRRVLAIAGPIAWLMVAAPLLLRWQVSWQWALAYLGFGAAFAASLQRPSWTLIAAQVAAVIAVVLAMCDGFEGALLVLVALQLGGFASRREALIAISAQTLLLGIAVGIHWTPQASLLLCPPWLGFELLAYFTAHGLIRERLRIARELHDRLGHKLAALSLNLEAAPRNPAALAAAREISRMLLGEVRAAVAELRDERFDLCRALRAIAEELPQPRVHVIAPDSLPLRDPQKALAVLRAAQEIATNAARHSQALNLWLTLQQEGQVLELSARDDGQGASALTLGNGLRGMRERLESAGGSLSLQTQPGQGFSLRARVPFP